MSRRTNAHDEHITTYTISSTDSEDSEIQLVIDDSSSESGLSHGEIQAENSNKNLSETKIDIRYICYKNAICNDFRKMFDLNQKIINKICISTDDQWTILNHRLNNHGGVIPFYMQIEQKNVNEKKCRSFVRITLMCNLCNDYFPSMMVLVKHFWLVHPNCCLDAQISKNIRTLKLDDQNQIYLTEREELTKFYIRRVFYCDIDSEMLGTRNDAILHHNKKHSANNAIQLILKQVLVKVESAIEPFMFRLENKHQQKEFLFRCLHCSNLFDSIYKIREHIRGLNESNIRFTALKLYACPNCWPKTMITTFEEMISHYAAKHANFRCAPAKMTNVKICGFCSYIYKTCNNLNEHFDNHHKDGELLTDDLLESLALDKINLDHCLFSPGCCKEHRISSLSSAVHHYLSNRLLKCNLCEGSKFQHVGEFLIHHNIKHKENMNQIIVQLQNYKDFIIFMSDMIIYFPDGFVTRKQCINGTNFGKMLQNAILQKIQEVDNLHLYVKTANKLK